MPSVLIVEDDRANREAFKRILKRAGFEVASVENGLDALDVLSRETYDVIVCDISMPLLSGIGFFEQLEGVAPGMGRRILFVTAYADDKRVREFIDKTGQPVLEKPVELPALVEAAQRVAAQKEKEED